MSQVLAVDDGSWTLDRVALELQAARATAGSPSYGEIAVRIGKHRQSQGLSRAASRIGRTTVYDVFRVGRRRIDEALVVDVVRALGGSEDHCAQWRRFVAEAQNAIESSTSGFHAGLPDGTPYFTGRTAELSTLMAGKGTLFAISGIGGSGKTALAIQAAHQLVDGGAADEAHLIDLRGNDPEYPPVSANAVLDVILRVLGAKVVPKSLVERRDALGVLLHQRRAVIVLDNAADETQLAPLLIECPTSIVIVTSRIQFPDIRVSGQVRLGPLDGIEGSALLGKLVGPDRVAAEPGSAKDLVSAADGFPLALTLIANQVSARPEWSLADHVAQYRARRSQLRLEDSMAAAIATAYERATPSAQRLIRMFAAQPNADLDLDAIAVLVDEPAEAVESSAAELERLHLLAPGFEATFQLHDVVRAYALDVSHDIDPPSHRDEARTRLLDHYMQTAEPSTPTPTLRRVTWKFVGAAVLGGLALNIAGTSAVLYFKLSLFLDMIGTAVTAIAVGPWWGALVGVLTNTWESSQSGWGGIWFSLVNVAGALIWGYGVRRLGFGRTLARYFGLNVAVAFAASIIAVPILVLVFGGANDHSNTVSVYQRLGDGLYQAVFTSNIFQSLSDKLVAGFIALIVIDRLRTRWQLNVSLFEISAIKPAPDDAE